MDALELLAGQHQRIDRFFDELLSCPPGERTRCFRNLAGALTQHAILEETHFYPALARHGAEAEVNDALRAHEAAKYQLETVCQGERERDAFRACIQTLRDEVREHIEDEEANLFPIARARLGEEALEALAEAIRGTMRLWEDYEPKKEWNEETPWLHPSSP